MPLEGVCGLPAGASSRLSPLGTLRRGAGRRGLCRRLADRRKRPERRSGRGGLAAVAFALSRPNARMSDSGSQFAVGWRAPTSASRPSAVGRCLGSFASTAGSAAALRSAPHPERVAVYHAVQQRRRGPDAERALAGGREGEDHPRLKMLGRRPDLVTGGLLGGHEPGRADHQACLRQRRGFHHAGDAEVDDPQAVLGLAASSTA